MPEVTGQNFDLIELIKSQTRVDTKLDLIIERLDKTDTAHDALRQRVDALEQSRAKTAGIVAAISALSGLVTAIVVAFFKSRFGNT